MKYIKCDCCGNKIKFGDEIWVFSGYCGIYCSADCFANTHGETDELTEEVADNCMCEVFDDEANKIKASAIKKQIEDLQRELKKYEDD